MKTRKWNRYFGLAAVGALALAAVACDPGADILASPDDDDGLNQAVAAAVTAEWDRLVTLEEVIDRAEQGLEGAPAGDAVRTLLSMAWGLHMEGEASRPAGDDYLVQAAVLALGEGIAHEAVTGAAYVLDRVDEVSRSRGPADRGSERTRELMRRAAAQVAEGRAALADGDPVAALHRGTAASESLRELAEDELAARWINRAAKLFDRATSMAGPNPEPPISAWLAAAEQMLGQARSAFDTGNYQAATSHAKASAQKSWKVIQALHEGSEPPGAEELAERAIEVATNLLARAWELAGSDPEPRVDDALAEARRLLDGARDAFGDGDFREAIQRARESGAISLRVINHLTGGRGAGR